MANTATAFFPLHLEQSNLVTIASAIHAVGSYHILARFEEKGSNKGLQCANRYE